MLQDLLVGGIAQGDGIEIVLLHELVEEVGTEHHRLGDRHLRILILVQFGMTLDDIVKECQSAPLASQRALADTGKVGITVKLQTVEDCHDTNVLHTTILDDGVEDDLTMCIYILQLMPGDLLQEG